MWSGWSKMNYCKIEKGPLISGAFIVVFTRTFVLMLAVAPVGLALPILGPVLRDAALCFLFGP